MSAVLADQETTYSTSRAARLLGARYQTVLRYVRRWHPPVGSGYRIRVTATDMLVLAAWLHIRGAGHQEWVWQQHALCDLAETAIRANPARWLALSPTWCETFHEAEDAAAAYLLLPRPRPAFTCIDLWRRP